MSEDLTKNLPQSDHEMLVLIVNRLDSVEQALAERLYDTRPIWEKVVADIAQLQEAQQQLQEGQQQLHKGQEALRTEVHAMRRDVYYGMDVLNRTLHRIQIDHCDFDERLRALEKTHNPPDSQT